MRKNKVPKLFVMNAAVSLGQKRAGVSSAPSFLWKHGLGEMLSEYLFSSVETETVKTRSAEFEKSGVLRSRAAGKACYDIYKFIQKHAKRGEFCLNLGGDHSIAAATLPAMLSAYKDLRIVWVDAHGDANTLETSPSGNLHGMPVAMSLGWMKGSPPPGFEWIKHFISAKRIALIGVRALDPAEKDLLDKAGVFYATADDVRKLGMKRVMKMVDERIGLRGKPVHVSFDVDALDPKVAASTGTRVKNGLNERDAHTLFDEINSVANIVGLDVAEFNPRVEPKSAEKTAKVILDIVASALDAVAMTSYGNDAA